MAAAAGGTVRKRGCGCSKDDFFPEESFRSWGHYARALGSTGPRLRERFFARSGDEVEIKDMAARSGNQMKKELNWWDLMCFGVGAVIGAGIFVLTGLEAKSSAGPAVLLSYVVSGISAMLSVLCYTEFAVEIPVAGGSFAYLRVELGDFVAFIAAGNILLEYVVSGAAVARSWSSYLATLCGKPTAFFRLTASGLPDDYSHLDYMAVAIIFVVAFLAIFSTKQSSRFNYIATVIHFLIIVFIIIAGLTKADTANYTPFAPFGAHGIFKSAAVLFFAYVGFDAVSTMAEETKNPARDIPIGLVGSMFITTAIYCLLAVTLCLMQPYAQINADAPFTVAFEATGMKWAKYIVAIGALKGMTTVLLVSAVGQARYLTHIARTHMVPPWLAKVSPTRGTPINATLVMATANAIIALFTELGILANLLSISTLFIFSLVALAVLVRRYYSSGETTVPERNKLIALLAVVILSSIGSAALWAAGVGGWWPYAVTVAAWFLATLAMSLQLKQAKKPKVWGVPVPWLPSASIAVNVFLLGSIDVMSYVRFGVWTLVLLVYYLLFGLHASYDSAKAAAERTDVEKAAAAAVGAVDVARKIGGGEEASEIAEQK